MQYLAWVFVAKPLNILFVALVLLAAHFLSLRRPHHRARRWSPLLVAALGWGLYAAWEWWVNAASPDANIRIDLLLIWPILAILTPFAIVHSLWPRS